MSVTYVDPKDFIQGINHFRMSELALPLHPCAFLNDMCKEFIDLYIKEGRNIMNPEDIKVRQIRASPLLSNMVEYLQKFKLRENIVKQFIELFQKRGIKSYANVYGVRIFEIGCYIYVYLIIGESI